MCFSKMTNDEVVSSQIDLKQRAGNPFLILLDSNISVLEINLKEFQCFALADDLVANHAARPSKSNTCT